MRIRAARIRNQIQPGCADAHVLRAEGDRAGVARENPMNRAVTGAAVKAGNARLIPVELRNEQFNTGGEFGRIRIGRSCRETLYNVGEADAVFREIRVVLRPKPFDTEPPPARPGSQTSARGTARTGSLHERNSVRARLNKSTG